MTKEELEKEASVYANAIERKASKEIVQIAYIDAAEPREKRIAELEKENSELKEKLKADLITNLKEKMQYSTSPSCTKGMELFIKSTEKWEIKENE